MNRRTVITTAVWSTPVIAFAIATPAAAASLGFDLVPTFASAITLDVTAGDVTVATADLFGELDITNTGAAPSTAGATVTLTYDASVVNIDAAGLGVTVIGNEGTRTLTLPSIAPGETLRITLSPTLLSSGVLALGVGDHAETITAVVTAAADTNQGNNTATGTIGITVLPGNDNG